jgi:hypothetical protein
MLQETDQRSLRCTPGSSAATNKPVFLDWCSQRSPGGDIIFFVVELMPDCCLLTLLLTLMLMQMLMPMIMLMTMLMLMIMLTLIKPTF